MRRHKRNNDQSSSFNNLTVLKHAIYHYGPQTVDELVEHIRKARPYENDLAAIRNIYVILALHKQKYFIKLEDERWDIEWDQAQAEEHRIAEKLLRAENGTLSLPDIRKRVAELLAKGITDVQIDLDSDPKFTPVGANHYALSEWHVLNDDAYELLAREPGRFLSEQQIISGLMSASQFIREAIVFSPKADPRFKKGPGGTWGLAEWWPSTAKKMRQLDTGPGPLIPVQVTVDHQTRVKVMASAIQAYVGASRDAVRPRQIVEHLLGVQVGNSDYPPLVRAVNMFLDEHDQFLRVGPEQWRLKEQVPSEVWQPVVQVSAPSVRGTNPPDWVEEDMPLLDPKTATRSETKGREVRAWKVTLTFSHWRAGTLGVPASKAALLSGTKGDVVELHVLVSGSISNECPVWFNRTTHTLYGLRMLYDSLGMVPGSVFRLTPAAHRADQLLLWFEGEVDPRVLREQSRLMDREALVKRAEEVGRTFREILVEVMRTSPEGLSFWEAFDQVSRIRPVAIATLRNLLSGLQCFYRREPGSGKWFYDPAKPAVRRRRRHLKPKARLHGLSLSRPRGASKDELLRPVSEQTDRRAGVSITESTPVAENVNVVEQSSSSDSSEQPRLGHHDGAQGSVEDAGQGERWSQEATPAVIDTPPTDREQTVVRENRGDGGNIPARQPVTVKERMAALIGEGLIGDKVLIREYLARYHGVTIDQSFVFAHVPPPESIRRARQLLLNTSGDLSRDEAATTTVRGRVGALLRDHSLRGDDRRLIVAYYGNYHNISISEEYLSPHVPAMETLRRTRQELTSSVKPVSEPNEEQEDPDWGWAGTSSLDSLQGIGDARPGVPECNKPGSELAGTNKSPSRGTHGRQQSRSHSVAHESRLKKLVMWLWGLITPHKAAK